STSDSLTHYRVLHILRLLSVCSAHPPFPATLAMDVGGPPLDCKITRLPVEVCEHIMDMLSSSRPFVEDTRALRCCALVCRAWRVRSQRNLFYSVVLRDLTALQRFSAVLDNGPTFLTLSTRCRSWEFSVTKQALSRSFLSPSRGGSRC
ncbi:hypothetical protein BD309DRAFT_94746, partial [Dichomitus squalens]